MFWFLGAAMLVAILVASGIVIWRAYFSAYFPIGAGPHRRASCTPPLHGADDHALIIVHVYAAIWTFAAPSGPCWYGTVTRAWAKQHHRAWYRQVTGK